MTLTTRELEIADALAGIRWTLLGLWLKAPDDQTKGVLLTAEDLVCQALRLITHNGARH